jgi:hypothetical protein
VALDTREHVRTYLERFPGLMPHVLPTVERARKEFDDAAELTLRINDDPESYDPYLKMYISLPCYGPDDVADRIDSGAPRRGHGRSGRLFVGFHGSPSSLNSRTLPAHLHERPSRDAAFARPGFSICWFGPARSSLLPSNCFSERLFCQTS